MFYVICYYDSTAGPTTRGPHMLDVGEPGLPQPGTPTASVDIDSGTPGVQPYSSANATAGTQAEMWDAWLEFLRTPVFGNVAAPGASSTKVMLIDDGP
jgi:hypothetical protein